jgi:hypothetical protein
MDGPFWSIAGIPVRITDSTRIASDVPISVGTTVAVTGIVAPDGARIATDVRVGTPLTSTPTAPARVLIPAVTSLAPANPATAAPVRSPPSPSTMSTSGTLTSVPPVAIVATPSATPLPRAALQNTLDNLSELRTTVNTKSNRDRLDQAIQHLSTSLDPSLWGDAAHLQRPTGEKVFPENKETVSRLREMLSEQKTVSPLLILQSFVDQIRDADRGLASLAVTEAIRSGTSQAAISRAQDEMAKGDADTTVGHSDSAIDHYQNAWQQVGTGRG